MKSTFQKILISAILERLNLDDNIVKTASWTSETLTGTGTVTAEVTKWEQAAPNMPAWIAFVSVLGMTFHSEDPDKYIIQTMHENCLQCCADFTPDSFVGTLPEGSTVAGILPVKHSEIRENEDQFMFTVDFGLAIVNTPF